LLCWRIFFFFCLSYCFSPSGFSPGSPGGIAYKSGATATERRREKKKMQSLMSKVAAVGRQYAANLKALLTIPPFSESMAGVIILFTFLNSMATSIWMFNAWTPFIFLLFNGSNVAVGIISGVNGLSELIFAMISGHVADKVWGPSRTLIFAVRLGILNLCIVMIAIWTCKRWLLIVAQVFEGCYMGLSFTCIESVFAQCLHTGERDRLYSVKFSMESSGPIVGLVSSIVLYLVVGDKWTTRVLQVVMTCGLLLHLTSMLIFTYLFKPLPSHLDEQREAAATDVAITAGDGCNAVDKDNAGTSSRLDDMEEKRVADTLGENDEQLSPSMLVQNNNNTQLMNCARTSIIQSTIHQAPRVMFSPYEPSVCTARNGDGVAAAAAPGGGGGDTTLSVHEQASTMGYDMDNDGSTAHTPTGGAGQQQGHGNVDLNNIPPGAHVEYVDHELEEATGWRRVIMKLLPLRIYPIAIVVCDMVLVIGSGMTTQYFSLFMMSVYHVSPAAIAALNLCNSVVIAFVAIISGAMGKRYGRIRAIIPPKMAGSLLLLYMALAQRTKYGPRFWMCVTYVFRNAFMNCSAGLSRALIMDLVPKERHSRWNALESVQSAGWSGTAILGGVMADHLGYGAAFIFTFFFHFFSTSALLPFAVRNDSRLPQPVLVYDNAPSSSSGAAAASQSSGGAAKSVSDAKDERSEVVVAELTVENLTKIASCVSLHRESDD
jgi:MFS family permease